jgi:hypothetical protein
MSGHRRSGRRDSSNNVPRDRPTTSIGYDPATEAERRAHLRKSLGGVLAVLAVFYATLALLIARIATAGMF